MNTLLHQAICQFAGCDDLVTVAPRNGLQAGEPPMGVVVSLSPSGSTKNELARQGYTFARWFFVLPSLASPRWLFPLANGRCTLAGLQIYKPYARTARISKGLLTALVAARCQGFALPRLLLASRQPFPLEDLVREVTGELQPVFSLSLGTAIRLRKLTIQVMRPDGEIQGYIKLPLTDAAVEPVRREAENLNHLWSFPALRSHIPRVLYAGGWGQGYILFQSGGPRRPGPAQFSRQSEEFLQLLWAIGPTKKLGEALWEEVAGRWQKVEPSLSSGWRALGQAALTKAKRELGGLMIPCGLSHGDFVPWNTRLGGHGLYVFDWEYASFDSPTLWDVFHFKTQVGALLNKKDIPHISRDRRPGERASLLLYLLSSACRLFGEESPAPATGLEFRRQLLANQLGGC